MKSKYEIHAAEAPRSACYFVKPRYTSGSPAMVDLGTALDLAADEEQMYERYLEGTYGALKSTWARNQGLELIVYARWERNHRLHKLDLITGTLTTMPVSAV